MQRIDTRARQDSGGGDVDALRQNRRWLRRLAYALTHNLDAAEDLVQETFSAVARNPERVAGFESSRAYLAGILRNVHRMWARTGARRNRREALSLLSESPRTPEADVVSQNETRLLLREIDALGEPYRTTILLRYYEDLRPADIATRLGIPQATVRKRNQLALERLRQKLETAHKGSRNEWLRSFAFAFGLPRPSRLSRPGTQALGRSFIVAAGMSALAAAVFTGVLRFPAGASASQVHSENKAEQRGPSFVVDGDPTADEPSPVNSEAENDLRSAFGATSPLLDGENAVGADGRRCASLQSQIDGAKQGARLRVPACIYREKVLIMDRSIDLSAEPGAEIRGSDIWREFSHHHAAWRSERTVPVFSDPTEDCKRRPKEPCHAPEQVYRDGIPLQRLGADARPGPDQFTLDRDRHVLLGSSPAGHTIEVTTRAGWLSIVSSHVSITGFTMKHSGGFRHSVAVVNPSNHVQLIGNRFSDAFGTLVALAGNDNLFENNDLRNGGAEGLRIEAGDRAIIRGNRIYQTGTMPAWGSRESWRSGGLSGVHGRHTTIVDNDIFDTRGFGIALVGMDNATITGNRIHDNAGSAINMIYAGRGTVIENNVLSNNGWRSIPREPAISLHSIARATIARNVLHRHPFGIWLSPLKSEFVESGDPCRDTGANVITGNTFVASGDRAHYVQLFGDPQGSGAVPACHTNRVEQNQLWTRPSGNQADPFASRAISQIERDRVLSTARVSSLSTDLY